MRWPWGYPVTTHPARISPFNPEPPLTIQDRMVHIIACDTPSPNAVAAWPAPWFRHGSCCRACHGRVLVPRLSRHRAARPASSDEAFARQPLRRFRGQARALPACARSLYRRRPGADRRRARTAPRASRWPADLPCRLRRPHERRQWSARMPAGGHSHGIGRPRPGCRRSHRQFFQGHGGQGRWRTRAREGSRRAGTWCRACKCRTDTGLLRRGTSGDR